MLHKPIHCRAFFSRSLSRDSAATLTINFRVVSVLHRICINVAMARDTHILRSRSHLFGLHSRGNAFQSIARINILWFWRRSTPPVLASPIRCLLPEFMFSVDQTRKNKNQKIVGCQMSFVPIAGPATKN